MYIVTMVQEDYNKALKRAYEDGVKKGKDFNKDEQNLNYRMGFNDGWHDCEASFELGNEFTDNIQEQAFDEGYDQAIDDLIEAGVIGETDEDCSEEGYSEYEFGDVEDEEEEYCFSKELDKILNGEFTSNINFDRDKKDTSNLGEYNRGYEDGKSRGITLGYNKRDYEYSKPKNQNDNLIENGDKESLMERKHSHYFKDVRHLDYVDIYQVCKLFEVNDPSHCTQHSIKKLLMSGKRGAKDKMKDIIEARDTLNRYLQIEGIE